MLVYQRVTQSGDAWLSILLQPLPLHPARPQFCHRANHARPGEQMFRWSNRKIQRRSVILLEHQNFLFLVHGISRYGVYAYIIYIYIYV